jgi:phosphocarrier protein
VEVANRFSSDILVTKDSQKVDGKSIMGILILAAACGAKIIVSADGADADEAVAAIGELVGRGFDELDD